MTLPLNRFVRRLAILWALSLISIGLLALTSSLLFADAITQSEIFSDTVSLAGRQRTLSQQIGLYASLYAQSETDFDRAVYAAQLRTTVDTMRAEFALLDTYTSQIPALRALYHQDETPVAELNRAQWDAADLLLGLAPDELSLNSGPYAEVLENTPRLLTLADRGVNAVHEASLASVAHLLQLNNVRLLLVAALLVGQFAFAFRPAILRLRRKASLLEHELMERMHAESELRASERRFRSVVETAPVGIFQTDALGAITWVNPHWETLMGLKSDAVKNTLWLEAIHPADREAVVAEAERTIMAGRPLMVDFRLAKKGRSGTTLRATVIPVKDEKGDVSGFLGMSMDITQRKLADQHALKLDAERQRVKVLGQFIRDTSHDLRTPLSVIKSGLYLVSRSTDIERIHEKVGVIDQHVTYLTVVIEQLHEMAVLDTLTDLTLMPMYATPLLRDAMNDLSSQADAAGKTAEFEFESDLPPTLIAPDKLMQAVRAVTNNALRYTEVGGCIMVKAAQVGKYVEICISDDGIGIASEHLPYVFDRFYKVDKARGTGAGAGLGLAIAKRVIELHGGQISLESTPGVGTVVRMTLIVAGSRLADLIEAQ